MPLQGEIGQTGAIRTYISDVQWRWSLEDKQSVIDTLSEKVHSM